MSVLRILRNLAVLVILAVGVLASTPRHAAAQVGCRIFGELCGGRFVCCRGLVCAPESGNRAICIKPR